MDANDYLMTEEAKETLQTVRNQVMLDVSQNPSKYQENGQMNPWRVEQELNRQLSAAREELTSETNLPDEYLSPEALREREARNPPPRWELE